MKRLSAILAAVCAVGLWTVALAAPPAFSAHSVPVFHGRPAAPDFRSAPSLRDLRTRISQGARAGVNFAGHYTIVTIGCGAACRLAVVVDAVTGRIIEFPLSGENYPDLMLEHRANSRLVRARWMGSTVEGDACLEQDFVLTGARFAPQVRRRSQVACP